MKVLRSTLLVAVAAVAAACGDKVTVAGPTTNTPAVHSVTVAPSTATLNINQAITMSAAVTADAGATVTPIAWTSSDPAKVSVSGTTTSATVTGLVATPGVAVCAAVGGASGCATIVVSPATAVQPATVSIASITANGTNNVTVNPNAVFGQIDVRLNINPGNQTVTKVVLVLGGVRVDSQTFSAAQAAALRSAADEAVATQSVFPQVLFSVNTAQFNAAGVPRWLNGPEALSASLYTSTAGAAAAATATAQTNLIFANVDGYIASVTVVATTQLPGSPNFAQSPTGFRFDRGGLNVTATPVIYTPGRSINATAGSNSVTFGSGCDQEGTGARTLTLTAPVAPSTAWTASFGTTTNSGALANSQTVINYEFSSAACGTVLNAIGETVSAVLVDQNGDAIGAGLPPLNVSALTNLRLDNRPPGRNTGTQAGIGQLPGFCTNTNFRSNNWINAAVALNSSTGCTAGTNTSNNWLVNGNADAGVSAASTATGFYVRKLYIAANSATNTVANAVAATGSSAATLPAPSLANTSLCAVVTASDALGNESPLPTSSTACAAPVVGPNAAALQPAIGVTVAAAMQFGVDIAPPTIAFDASSLGGAAPAAPIRINTAATIGGEIAVTVLDTGIVGNSGMNAGAPVSGTVVVVNASGASPVCFQGAAATSSNPCPNQTFGVLPALPVISTVGGKNPAGAVTPMGTQGLVGYYTFTGIAKDAAGNTSAAVTRVISYDLTGNVPTLTTASYPATLVGGSAVTFTASASDNFDLWKIGYTLTYGGGLVGPLVFAPAIINPFNSGTLMNTSVAANYTIASFIRQIEAQTSACSAAFAVSAQFKPTALSGVVTDNANVPSAAVPSAIAPASVPTGVSYFTPVDPNQKPLTWSISNGVTGCVSPAFAAAANAAVNVSTGAGPAAAVNALSVTVTADAWGKTAVFNSPFTRVDFYAQVGANLELIGTSTAETTPGIDDGSANGRRHRWSITWTPGVNSPITATPWVLGAQNIYAVGVNSVGDALVTPVNANITLTNP